MTATDPYADEWHQGRDCTYRCSLTGRTLLAYHDDRYVVVDEDEWKALRDLATAARSFIAEAHDAPGGGVAVSTDVADDIYRALARLDEEDAS